MAKIMISLPADMLKEIDEAADQEHRTRSDFFREAVRQYFQSRKKKRPMDDAGTRAAYEHMRLAAIEGSWDSTDEIRRSRKGRLLNESSA